MTWLKANTSGKRARQVVRQAFSEARPIERNITPEAYGGIINAQYIATIERNDITARHARRVLKALLKRKIFLDGVIGDMWYRARIGYDISDALAERRLIEKLIDKYTERCYWRAYLTREEKEQHLQEYMTDWDKWDAEQREQSGIDDEQRLREIEEWEKHHQRIRR